MIKNKFEINIEREGDVVKEMEVVAFLEDQTYTSTVRKSNPDSPFWQLFLDLEFTQEGRWRIICGFGIMRGPCNVCGFWL